MPTQVVAIAAQPAGLELVQGDAQNLHFPDQSFVVARAKTYEMADV